MMIVLAALLLQDVQAPVSRQPGLNAPAPDPASLSIVIADTVDQVDPQPLCLEPGCTSLFLGRFINAQVLAGPPVSPAFEARLEMGSPYISRYRLALIVERRAGADRLVRAAAGFNSRTGIACFELKDTQPLGWQPSGAGISVNRGEICIKQ